MGCPIFYGNLERCNLPNAAVGVLITAFGDVESYLDSMELGAYEYINKPFETEQILDMIEKISAA